jgi:EAL domain-containing protein (putative c-di-GMP-specific phosphodiesterase class I)
VEALVRWRHPQRGLVMPDMFIPIAEETGLIIPLGAWVIEEACRQRVLWRNAGLAHISIAVNLSVHQLYSPDFTGQVQAIMDRHAIGEGELKFEITESAAMDNPEYAIQQLQKLRALGIELAIDDFGTGYSSLAYIKRLPIQLLKLDRTFVDEIDCDENDAAIGAATVALAHNLGLKVIAEGVETRTQRQELIDLRCDYLQGYLFSKPLPADQAMDVLARFPLRGRQVKGG